MRFSKCKDWTGFCDRLGGRGHNQWILLVGRF